MRYYQETSGEKFITLENFCIARCGLFYSRVGIKIILRLSIKREGSWKSWRRGLFLIFLVSSAEKADRSRRSTLEGRGSGERKKNEGGKRDRTYRHRLIVGKINWNLFSRGPFFRRSLHSYVSVKQGNIGDAWYDEIFEFSLIFLFFTILFSTRKVKREKRGVKKRGFALNSKSQNLKRRRDIIIDRIANIFI